MSEKKTSLHQRVTIIFHDKEFLREIDAYSEFMSTTRTDAIYNILKNGFENLKNNLPKSDLDRLNRVREMLLEIDKNKK